MPSLPEPIPKLLSNRLPGIRQAVFMSNFLEFLCFLMQKFCDMLNGEHLGGNL